MRIEKLHRYQRMLAASCGLSAGIQPADDLVNTRSLAFGSRAVWKKSHFQTNSYMLHEMALRLAAGWTDRPYLGKR